MNLKQIIEASDREFDERYPQFIGSGAPFPIFRDTPNRNHIVLFLHERDRKILEGVKEALDTLKENIVERSMGTVQVKGAEYYQALYDVTNLINQALEN